MFAEITDKSMNVSFIFFFDFIFESNTAVDITDKDTHSDTGAKCIFLSNVQILFEVGL